MPGPGAQKVCLGALRWQLAPRGPEVAQASTEPLRTGGTLPPTEPAMTTRLRARPWWPARGMGGSHRAAREGAQDLHWCKVSPHSSMCAAARTGNHMQILRSGTSIKQWLMPRWT